MKVFIIGATGRTARILTRLAVARGHAVTAFVRDASKLPPLKNLDALVGDVRNTKDLSAAIRGHDAVISCLGQRSSHRRLLHDAAVAVLQAMQNSDVRRYLAVSQGLLFDTWNPIVLLIRAILKRRVLDSRAMESVILASGVVWTIVRPSRLMEGRVAEGYVARLNAQPTGPWTMQYIDLATFLLDATEQELYPRSIVGVTSG
jgi:uncharacterized protein YbjT (DUF2867 family)